MFLVASDGQRVAATAVCLAISLQMALRVRWRPLRLGNSGSAACPPRSRSHSWRTARVWRVSGVHLVLRPLPRHLTHGVPSSWTLTAQGCEFADA